MAAKVCNTLNMRYTYLVGGPNTFLVYGRLTVKEANRIRTKLGVKLKQLKWTGSHD